jgi:hypothetical protein
MICSFGDSPADFHNFRFAYDDEGNPIRPAPGTVTDSPNFEAFGTCRSPSNPEVLAAQAAALGVATPVSCRPALGKWTAAQDAKRKFDGEPMLDEQSTCTCASGGEISFHH